MASATATELTQIAGRDLLDMLDNIDEPGTASHMLSYAELLPPLACLVFLLPPDLLACSRSSLSLSDSPFGLGNLLAHSRAFLTLAFPLAQAPKKASLHAVFLASSDLQRWRTLQPYRGRLDHEVQPTSHKTWRRSMQKSGTSSGRDRTHCKCAGVMRDYFCILETFMPYSFS